ncbi:LexA family protein [Streptomyces sp. NBC_00829]|uniref:LexA family protein n=1 Tax=Streptomyces sp. NBC_00829 TaxID=2903679 RepID=UPI00387070AC|nr:winged helix DNA-binding protein [Streptomyces sp. NBC_00829]
MADHLTERQSSILRCVTEWIAEYGEGPTIREIGARVGLSSTSSVAYQLRRMEEAGVISRTGRRWRSCRLGN